MTNKLQQLIAGSQYDAQVLNEIKDFLHQFIVMYRPHESREDTVIFPHIRSLVTEKEYAELAETCEDIEEKMFGEDGFELMLQRVEEIEKTLGIYELH
jgi:hemerythrin-like domain-containing protein